MRDWVIAEAAYGDSEAIIAAFEDRPLRHSIPVTTFEMPDEMKAMFAEGESEKDVKQVNIAPETGK